MTHPGFTESVVEDAALAWLEGLGYAALHGTEIAVDAPGDLSASSARRRIGRQRQ